jgi:hypothetical protein
MPPTFGEWHDVIQAGKQRIGSPDTQLYWFFGIETTGNLALPVVPFKDFRPWNILDECVKLPRPPSLFSVALEPTVLRVGASAAVVFRHLLAISLAIPSLGLRDGFPVSAAVLQLVCLAFVAAALEVVVSG